MPKGIRVCKVCGAEYPYCKTENRGNRFRYQDVACCPQHGSVYFAEIAKSRGLTDTKEATNIVSDFSDLIDEEDDTFDEESEDYEDDDEWF